MTIEEYSIKDNTFNKAQFIGEVNRMIQKICIAINNNDLDSVHYYMNDKVYNKIKSIIDRAKEKGNNIKYDNIFIDSIISEICIDRGTPKIRVSSTCKFSKYYVSNGEIVNGSNIDTIQILHDFYLCKNDESLPFYCCKGCGASYDIYLDKKCPHCGNIFDDEEFDYYIVEMG